MKFFSFLYNIFFIKKVKSKIGDNISNWEMLQMYKSIKKNNNIVCLNCESNILKLKSEYNYLYCDLCGQIYVIFTLSNINNFSKEHIVNLGILENIINIDVVRYNKIKKLIKK